MNSQDTAFHISKEANKALLLFKAEQVGPNKSQAVLVAIAKAKKWDKLKYKNQ